MTIDTGFLIGYAGWARVKTHSAGTAYINYHVSQPSYDGRAVLVTSASYSRSLDVPTTSSFYLPQAETGNNVVRSKIRLGHGVYSYGGSIAFELTNESVKLITDDLFRRNSHFSVVLCDGELTLVVPNCVWNNLSIAGDESSIATMSISFQSNNGYVDDMQLASGRNSPPVFDENERLIPYWQTGMAGIESFDLSFSRSVSAVYLNNSLKTPSYLKAGRVDVSLDVNCVEECLDDLIDNGLSIKIGKSKTINMLAGVLKDKEYSMSSYTDVGMKSYKWDSIADSSTGGVFSIT